MKEKIEIIKNFKGKKEYCVWDMESARFIEISPNAFFALAYYSTCGLYAWRIDVRKTLSGVLTCYLEPNFSDRVETF